MAKTLDDKARERLRKARNLWVATVRADGRPHLVPVWFVFRDDRLYICIEPNSVKGRNLRANGRLSVATDDAVHPVICEGESKAVEQPWPGHVVETFQSKYEWDIVEEKQYTMLVEIIPRKWLHW